MHRWLFPVFLALAAGLTFPQAPPEVGPTLTFPYQPADKQTLSWDPVAGAEAYNLYRGQSPALGDLSCFVFRTPGTSATDTDTPAPGSLSTYLVTAWNAQGEGPAGFDSSGAPRTITTPCDLADNDADGVLNPADNCPELANAAQLDQDLDGEGDTCDPSTYDFEADSVMSRPAEMTQRGGVDGTFRVRDYSSDQGAAYDTGGVTGVHDAFDRLVTLRRHQDIDVYLDSSDAVADSLVIELWSEGTWSEEAGSGVQLVIDSSGGAEARRRDGRSFTSLGTASLTDVARLRLRLRQDPSDSSSATLHLDRWDGAAWSLDEGLFTLSDIHLLWGRTLSLAHHADGSRPVLRVTEVVLPGSATLGIDHSFDGLDDWKLFQRDGSDTATIVVPLSYREAAESRLELRVVETLTGNPLPGFDWPDHGQDLSPAPDGASVEFALENVPAGGNYDIEARLLDPVTSNLLGSDSVHDVAVGDVFLASGQSNMVGNSGGLSGGESPIDRVHVFGNDYAWKRADEPMDDGTDQTDRVSQDSPQHSLMLSFAKTVESAAGVPVAVIPAPKNGSNLFSGWKRSSSVPFSRATLYGSSVHRVLEQGYGRPIRGVLFYQGESDTGRSTAAYRADLENLVSNYRSDLGDSQLFFANVQLATYQFANLDSWLAIQEAQRQQAEADPLSVAVAVTDLDRNDSIHLSTPSYIEAGQRLARAVLDGLYGLPQSLGPQLVSVAFSSAARTGIDITFDKSVSGGAASIFVVEDVSGTNPVLSVSNNGAEVHLELTRASSGTTTLTYGWDVSPTGPWILADDGSGPPLAFYKLEVSP